MRGIEWNIISHRTGASQRESLSSNSDICRKNDGVDISGVASESLLGPHVLINFCFLPFSVSSTIIWKPWWASSRHIENRDSLTVRWRTKPPATPAYSRGTAKAPAQTPIPLLLGWAQPREHTMAYLPGGTAFKGHLRISSQNTFGFDSLSYMQGQDKITF